MPAKLCSHLEGCGVLPMLYAASWLMTCFSADFPYSFSARVMDVIMSDKMSDALLKVRQAVAESVSGLCPPSSLAHLQRIPRAKWHVCGDLGDVLQGEVASGEGRDSV